MATTTAVADATREAEDVVTLDTYRVKSDGVATKTYMDQFECEQSCGMFFFPLDELPEDQQLQLQASGFTNAALEVHHALCMHISTQYAFIWLTSAFCAYMYLYVLCIATADAREARGLSQARAAAPLLGLRRARRQVLCALATSASNIMNVYELDCYCGSNDVTCESVCCIMQSAVDLLLDPARAGAPGRAPSRVH